MLSLLLFALVGLGCASRAKPVARAELEMTAVVGTLLEERLREERFYRGASGHETWWWSEIELAVETPAEWAGTRRRVAMPLGWPVSYAKWKGKRVRLTLPRAELARLAARPEGEAPLPLTVAGLEELPGSR